MDAITSRHFGQGKEFSTRPVSRHGAGCFLPALEVSSRLLVWVDGRGRSACTCWKVLLVLLLAFWAIIWACSICGQLKHLLLAHTLQVHALLSKQVLTHGAVLAMVDTNFPWQTSV